ncbi:substrate-binding domain-containing protein [Brachybacterium sp. GPGPB12]|uniref:substrate-binding domain-containing protein n=1 Tax=Brachybacterium sp. GPGPB12 TaxID=3023517 RepID=UPI0031343707
MRALRSLIAQQVDALVLVGTHRYGTEDDTAISTPLQGFERNGGKVVGLGQSLGVGRTIISDDAADSHELATALVVEGHRRFAVVEGIPGIPSAGSRTSGFIAALTEAGIEPELSIAADLTRDGGIEAAARVQEHLEGAGGSDQGPLCLFAPADMMALGALGEPRRRGLDVPGQVAVAGFGGVTAAADANPSLTTLAPPLSEMAAQAAAWALEGVAPAHRSGDEAEAASGSDEEPSAEGAADPVREVRVRGDVAAARIDGDRTPLTARHETASGSARLRPRRRPEAEVEVGPWPAVSRVRRTSSWYRSAMIRADSSAGVAHTSSLKISTSMSPV